MGCAALIGIFVLIGHNSAATATSKRKSDANRAIPVRTAAATTGSVDRNVDALETVTALNTVTVRSRVDGPLIEVPFHEGQLVKSGDLLARIDPRTFQVALDQAVGTLAHDQSQLADARVDLDRYNGLLAKDSIAKQQVDSQVYMVKQLEGTVKSDQAQVANARLQLEFTRITAPFPGRVGLRQIDMGNMIHASDTTGLVLLTQTHPITVVFAVPSDQLSQILPLWRTGTALSVDALDRDGKSLAHGQLAQSQLESARAAAFDLAVTRHTLGHAIAVLVGRPPSELTIERTNALPDVPESPAIVPAALLERRPDIASAERRAAAANAQIGVARAAYFPDLTLTGTGGYDSRSSPLSFAPRTASGPSAPTWPKPFSTQAPFTPRSNKTSPPTIST